ncbi:hypothetical protein MGN70_001215 [Eutypa lata]|uniref:Putative rta1 domain protein n=1 Tax=Eutypa lata (strain UCR-EL1) TaxID=1287681 RepID=M7SR36_EUTLA|nr:putative rta1 domain protein [Eutypa lata UCREL1]KAI1258166.1 hypothetical protein MGN70_001215 [Eutypa lata]
MSSEDQSTGGDVDFGFDYYRYDPSMGAALLFVILFGISSALHLFQLVRHRTWYFIPFMLGGVFEALGYVGRIISSGETPEWTMGPYILQTVMILVAAAMMAASIYMILGRLTRLLEADHHSVIPVKWTSKIFVTTDVISIIMQAAGGAMLAIADTPDQFKTGENIIIGGLFVQLVAFGIFIVVAGIFYRRVLRDPTPASQTVDVPWQRYMWVVFAGSSLILIRSVFRVIEYLQGNAGYLMSHEVFLYLFDGVLMIVVMVLFNVYHPSRIINKRTTMKAAGWDSAMDSSEVELRTV